MRTCFRVVAAISLIGLAIFPSLSVAQPTPVHAHLWNVINDNEVVLDFQEVSGDGTDALMEVAVATTWGASSASATWSTLHSGEVHYSSFVDMGFGDEGTIGAHGVSCWQYTFVADTDGQFRVSYEVFTTDTTFQFLADLNAGFEFIWTGDSRSYNNALNDPASDGGQAHTFGVLTRDMLAGEQYSAGIGLGGYGGPGPLQLTYDLHATWSFDVAQVPVPTQPSSIGRIKALYR